MQYKVRATAYQPGWHQSLADVVMHAVVLKVKGTGSRRFFAWCKGNVVVQAAFRIKTSAMWLQSSGRISVVSMKVCCCVTQVSDKSKS